jgi:hypothetical protein
MMIPFARVGLAGALVSAVALSGCATVEEAAVESTADTYRATLTGAQEPMGGDPDGTGRAEISVADDLDQICWDVNDIRNIGPVTGIHIHRGARGVDGPVVMPLTQANEGGWKGCTSKGEWLQDALEGRFTGYYVNVHTAEYPNGAIRGQLGQ